MKKMPRGPSTRTSKNATRVKPSRTASPAPGSPVVSADAIRPVETPPAGSRWTFLSNHSHVLILISRNPSVVLRQVASDVGITERAVQRIIADLEEAGIIEREKVGRQNRYHIMSEQPLRHSVESHRTIRDLLALMELRKK